MLVFAGNPRVIRGCYLSRKIALLLAALLLANIAWVGAQESDPEQDPFTPQSRTNQRSLGDQAFAISAGLFVPLPVYLLNDWPKAGYTKGFTDSKLSIGGLGSLAYSFYLSGNFKLGIQVTGSFARDINYNFAYLIPIVAKASWEFHPWSRISIPLHIGLGMVMTSYKDYFVIDPIIRPGFGVYFDWNYEWSFGMDMSYWFVPQLGSSDKSQRSIAQFVDVTLTAEYHF